MTFRGASRRGFMAGVGATLLAGFRRSAVAAPAFKTVEPGVLTIANSNEMPMIAMEDGKLIGSDAEIIETIACQDGPRLQVRADGMVGDRAVRQERARRHHDGQHGMDAGARRPALLITDAIYLRGHHGLHESRTSLSPQALRSTTPRATRSGR